MRDLGVVRESWLLAGCLAAVLFAVSVLGADTAFAAAPVSCKTVSGIPVALESNEPAVYTITGELCATPSELTDGETIQLMIHGASYNHSYWDFGTVDGIGYSYARDLAAAGFPTFAFDEVGAGASSRPPSSMITIEAAAYVAHQLVQDLQHGLIGGVRFAKVILVGHSLGSGTAETEAATYRDVAGVIVTGDAHSNTSFVNQVVVPQDFYPAMDDPKFAGSGLDSGYITTRPGTRGPVFYTPGGSDPNVIAADDNDTPFTQQTFSAEAGKDAVSGTELAGVFPLLTSTYTKQINAPVLTIIGSEDKLLCGAQENGTSYDCSSGTAIAGEEAPYWSAAAQLRACSVPRSGHDISLELDHVWQEADALAWSYQYVGQDGLTLRKSAGLPPGCNPFSGN
jgi:pimeloyl-ACP methyl ester carboxylesterase